MSKDMNESAKFYRDLFGWQLHEQPTSGPPYAIFQLGDDQICGMGQMSAEMVAGGMPPVWNSYVHCEDLAAAATRITELGGQILMPQMQVEGAGSMLILQDPTGAAVSLWQPSGHYGADLANVANTWCWNELATTDTAAAQSFYTGLFGWTFEDAGGSPTPYFSILNGDRKNGGMMNLPPGAPGSSHWSVYFTVEDADEAAEKIKQLGGKLVMDLMDIPGTGRMGVATDIQGAFFNFMAMSVEPD